MISQLRRYPLAGRLRRPENGDPGTRSASASGDIMQADIPEPRKKGIGRKAGRWLLKALAGFQGRQSLVGDKPVFDASLFPFLRPFERDWNIIRAELEPILAERERLPAFHEISPDQYRISLGDQWKVFVLYGFGIPSPKNCARCPHTTRLLADVPGLQSAWFSILAPRYHIPRHRGPTKGLLKAHLGLKVPAQRLDCTMEVDDQRLNWEQGKVAVFDDFYPHEVWNNTDEERVVLLFEFLRPMRLPGRMVHKFLLWGIKQSAYSRDATRNMQDWDQRLAAAVANADSMYDEPAPR